MSEVAGATLCHYGTHSLAQFPDHTVPGSKTRPRTPGSLSITGPQYYNGFNCDLLVTPTLAQQEAVDFREISLGGARGGEGGVCDCHCVA